MISMTELENLIYLNDINLKLLIIRTNDMLCVCNTIYAYPFYGHGRHHNFYIGATALKLKPNLKKVGRYIPLTNTTVKLEISFKLFFLWALNVFPKIYFGTFLPIVVFSSKSVFYGTSNYMILQNLYLVLDS